MGFHKNLVRVLLVSALLTGCPFEDDKPVDAQKGNASGTGDESSGSGGSNKPEDDDDDDTDEDEGGNTGDPVVVEPEEDAGVEDLDAAVEELDAGPVVVDSGTPEPDAAVVVPATFDAAGVPDAERAKLIYDLMIAQGYVQNWFSFLQTTGAQRPLVIGGGHSNQVRVRQNGVAKQAIDAWVAKGKVGPLVMPTGSIIAKESYKLGTDGVTYTLNDIRVMAKLDVLDPTMYEGKWFYMKFTPATNVVERSTTCNGCHNGRTNKALWPVNTTIPMDPGGKVDALVPYDYLVVPFCADPANVLLCKPPA